MKLSIVIPVYNEETTVEKIVDLVLKAPLSIDKELIIVDDCSSDNTRTIIESRLSSKVAKIIFHEKNQGKGAALRTGFAAATGDIVIVQDADLEYNPNEFQQLITPILEDKADVVYGSRFASGQPHRVLYFWHSVGNRLLTMLSNMFSDLNLTDMETCYKAFRREIIASIEIEENRFGFEPEITAKIARIKGIRIYEAGISYSGRTYEEGKKIGWRDGVAALWCILKYNLRQTRRARRRD
ncbi:MAG: glycosyl transferase [Candidatus Riflebacteria bacterium HGW-Riflebacteria-2]|nr:MAG: glycosyl transferase [Candidatus Riflebacteria bacterium HGW-Riflebacteria-2]